MNASPGIRREINRWLEAFAACVRDRDFKGARTFFMPGSHGFGTVARAVDSRAKLERGQWRRVWPVTAAFRFERTGARMEISADESMVVIMATWKACNHPMPKRLVFDRHGRATLVLRRAGPGKPWRAVHTHFSFDPAGFT